MTTVLTIAGTDPSSAAGIQADLRVIADHGQHGVSVITAVLAQNTAGVRAIFPMDLASVEAQLAAVFDDFDVAAVKIGLVPNDDLVELIAARVGHLPTVWDPVLASGDGETQLFTGSVAALRKAFAVADIVTPNAFELGRLTELESANRDQASAAGLALCGEHNAVLVKVGHLERSDTLSDIWVEHGQAVVLEPLPAIEEDVRGTGCHLSTAIACGLADGMQGVVAVESARRYLSELLTGQTGRPGRGRAIIGHAR